MRHYQKWQLGDAMRKPTTPKTGTNKVMPSISMLHTTWQSIASVVVKEAAPVPYCGTLWNVTRGEVIDTEGAVSNRIIARVLALDERKKQAPHASICKWAGPCKRAPPESGGATFKRSNDSDFESRALFLLLVFFPAPRHFALRRCQRLDPGNWNLNFALFFDVSGNAARAREIQIFNFFNCRQF